MAEAAEGTREKGAGEASVEQSVGEQARGAAVPEAASEAAAGDAGDGGSQTPVRGKCKWFSLSKCYGFITPDDGSQDVFVHQKVIKMGGYRSLETNEEVEYLFKISDKGREATVVTGPSGADCKGSKRRLRPKYRRTANRCFNCGQSGHHAKDCPQPPLPKRCYACHSEDHLWADCPNKTTQGNGDGSGNGSGDGNGNGSGNGNVPASNGGSPREEATGEAAEEHAEGKT